MGLEPAFSRSTIAWPLAGPGAVRPEPDDPHLAIPHGALQSSLRDSPEKNYIADTSGELATTRAEPLDAAWTRPAEHHRKWTAAIIVSCIFHAALAMVLLSAPGARLDRKDATQIEGSDQSGVMVTGNASDDQSAAGQITEDEPNVTKVTLVPMVDPKPVKTVEAQPVTTTDAVQPTRDMAEAPVMETLQPTQEAAEQPAAPERVEPAAEEPMRTAAFDPQPEILASETQQPVDDNVVQPTSPATPKAEPAKTAKAIPAETVQTIIIKDMAPPKSGKKKPEPKPVKQAKPAKEKPAKPVEKEARKDAEEQPAKPARQKTKAGSGGSNEADNKRGMADGQDGRAAIASTGGKKSIGNASVSNYPGKVAAKLQRVPRSTSNAVRAKARNNARISFVVNADGGVDGLRVVKSSGSPDLDQAALNIVRRAAPFPPIPPEAGRSSWPFTVPIGPF